MRFEKLTFFLPFDLEIVKKVRNLEREPGPKQKKDI